MAPTCEEEPFIYSLIRRPPTTSPSYVGLPTFPKKIPSTLGNPSPTRGYSTHTTYTFPFYFYLSSFSLIFQISIHFLLFLIFISFILIKYIRTVHSTRTPYATKKDLSHTRMGGTHKAHNTHKALTHARVEFSTCHISERRPVKHGAGKHWPSQNGHMHTCRSATQAGDME